MKKIRYLTRVFFFMFITTAVFADGGGHNSEYWSDGSKKCGNNEYWSYSDSECKPSSSWGSSSYSQSSQALQQPLNPGFATCYTPVGICYITVNNPYDKRCGCGSYGGFWQ